MLGREGKLGPADSCTALPQQRRMFSRQHLVWENSAGKMWPLVSSCEARPHRATITKCSRWTPLRGREALRRAWRDMVVLCMSACQRIHVNVSGKTAVEVLL